MIIYMANRIYFGAASQIHIRFLRSVYSIYHMCRPSPPPISLIVIPHIHVTLSSCTHAQAHVQPQQIVRSSHGFVSHVGHEVGSLKTLVVL